MRAIHDSSGNQIYSLIHAEKLKYLIAEKAMDLINFLSQGKPGTVFNNREIFFI